MLILTISAIVVALAALIVAVVLSNYFLRTRADFYWEKERRLEEKYENEELLRALNNADNELKETQEAYGSLQEKYIQDGIDKVNREMAETNNGVQRYMDSVDHNTKSLLHNESLLSTVKVGQAFNMRLDQNRIVQAVLGMKKSWYFEQLSQHNVTKDEQEKLWGIYCALVKRSLQESKVDKKV